MSKIIYKMSISSPLGAITCCATDVGLCLLEFSDHPILDKIVKNIQSPQQTCLIVEEQNIHLQKTNQQITEYFAGQRKTFDIDLDIIGTEFQQKVWNILKHIPYGTTLSYAKQAALVGNAKAVRAVARANSCNWISIIIPCHRVIGSTGKLTGYAGGIERKAWLLALEKRFTI